MKNSMLAMVTYTVVILTTLIAEDIVFPLVGFLKLFARF